MLKRILFFWGGLVFFISCELDQKTANTNDQVISRADTTISFTINAENKNFLVKKELLKFLTNFQDFLNKYPTVPLTYFDTLEVDINSDSINEFIISKIENHNSKSTIFSTIIMGNLIIKQDTLVTNDDLAFIDWASDSIYFKLKPYSSFFIALQEKNVVEELVNGKLDDGIIEFYTNGIEAQLKNDGFDTKIVNYKIDSISNELHKYNGKIITTLEHWDRSILIWNKYNNDFELIYTP